MKRNNTVQKGFTLIEILVVIGLIAILAAVVIIAINPSRQFKQGRDSQRLSNLNAILNGLGQRIADNKGIFAGTVPDTNQQCPPLTASTTGAGGILIASLGNATSSVDLSCLVPVYIPSQLPMDPDAGTGALWKGVSDYNTQYYITVDVSGRITLKAPHAELLDISVTR